jgi:hypothetical protein
LPTCANSSHPPILGQRNGRHAIAVPDETRLDLSRHSALSSQPTSNSPTSLVHSYSVQWLPQSLQFSLPPPPRERIDYHAKWKTPSRRPPASHHMYPALGLRNRSLHPSVSTSNARALLPMCGLRTSLMSNKEHPASVHPCPQVPKPLSRPGSPFQ